MPFHAGDIEASLELDRGPFNRGLSQARADADKFEKKKITATIDVDKTKFDEAMRGGTSTSNKRINIPVNIDQRRVNQQLDQIGKNTEKTANRSGNRMARALLNPIVIQLAALPAIAAASAALSGVALGAMVGVFAAIGGASLKENEVIKNSYKDLWDTVKTDTKQAAQVLQPYGVNVARELWSGFKTIEPQLVGIFSAIGPQVMDLTKGLVGLATNAMPGIERSIRLAGPTVRGLSAMLQSTGTGLGQFFEQISSRSLDTGHGMQLLGQIIQTTLNNVGRLAATFSHAWSEIGPNFSRVFDKMLDAINNFVAGGVPAFTGSLKVTLGVLEALLNVIGPFADIIGGSAGWLLGAAASWKILAGSIGLVTKAAGQANPATWAGKFGGFTKAIDSAAVSTGGMITKISGMPMAGAQFSNVMSKIGNAAAKAGSFIPIIGVGVAGVMAAIDHFFPSADDLAHSLQAGGKDAEEARKKMVGLGKGYQESNFFAAMFGAKTEEVAAALRRQRDSMTGVERAQADVVQAQHDYQFAVDKFGRSSPQAIAAQDHLAASTKGVEDAQLKAAQATQTHIDKIIFQTNLMLGSIGARLNYQASLISLEKAQTDVAVAIKDHGVKSIEAREADNAYQRQLISTITSLGERAKAENADKTETEQNRLATFAMHQEIARLAVIAGKDAPPALQQLASMLSTNELAALGVTKKVNEAGVAIYTLPPGKTLNFPTDAPIAQAKVEQLTNAVNNLPAYKGLTYAVNVVTNNVSSLPGLMTGWAPPRAEGGPVHKNMPYWVGEKGVPELFFPNVDGFVLNGRDSARVGSAQTGTAATTPALGAGGATGSGLPVPVEVLVEMLVRALDGLRLRIDGQEWARLVNSVNVSNTRK